MAQGKLVAEHPELEALVIEMLQKGCAYKHIIKKAKERFNINISYALITQYKKNYLPVEIVLPKRKRKSPKSIEGETIPISKMDYASEIKEMKGRMIDGGNILNFYASRISMAEVLLDQLLKKKKNLTKGEIKNFTDLVKLQDKLYQQVLKLFKDDRRKKEIYEIIWGLCSLVVNVFLKEIKKEEENIYHKKIDKFYQGISVIVKKYLGEEIEALDVKSLDLKNLII